MPPSDLRHDADLHAMPTGTAVGSSTVGRQTIEGSTAANRTAESSSVEGPTVEGTARRTRSWAVGTALGLIVLGLLWELALAPTGARTLALKVAPLAALLPGLVRMRLSSYRAASLLVWLYALEGALRGVSDAGVASRLAWVELLLALALFAACVAHVRARVGPRRRKAPHAEVP